MQIIFPCWASMLDPQASLEGVCFYTSFVQGWSESITKPEVYLAVCMCFRLPVLKSRAKILKSFQPVIRSLSAWQGNCCNGVFWWALCWKPAKRCRSPQTLQMDPFHWTHANVSQFKTWKAFCNDSHKYQELHKTCRRAWEWADRL